MSFYKIKLVGEATPKSKQAERIVNKIRGRVCCTMVDEYTSWGLILPDRRILSVNSDFYCNGKKEPECRVTFDGEKWYRTTPLIKRDKLEIRESQLAPDVSMPPVSYSKPGQFLFGYNAGRLETFERLKGRMGLQVENYDKEQLWSGLPLFTRYGFLTGVVLGVRKKQYLCVSPHPIFNRLKM